MQSLTAEASGSTVPGALAGVRVLEVAGPLGAYTGKMFAGLGADVILVEPPTGDPVRRRPPFVDDLPDAEQGLWFNYLHTGKRGITLDLDTLDGQALFRRLATTSSVVIESEAPRMMAARGLGYSDLATLRPGLVYTSVTAFGQEGPYSGYAATDTTLLALGGLLCLGGYTDTEPIRAHGDQAVLAAGQFAAIATMLALLPAEAGGPGRQVDISAQECVVMALENAAQYYDLEGRVRRRTSGMRHAGMGVYPCKDGYVYMLVRGLGTSKFWHPTLQWIRDEGGQGVEPLFGSKWDHLEYLETDEAKRIFAEVWWTFGKNHTKAELYQKALEKRIPLCPVSTPADLLASAQLKDRRFFVEMFHPALDRTLVMPGAPYLLSQTPWQLGGPAPTLGQHNVELYGELGLGSVELSYLKAAGVI